MIQIDMEMPKGCWDCPCYNDDCELCKAKKRKLDWIEYLKGKPDWCPWIEAKE